MKICTKKEHVNPQLILGHLYKRVGNSRIYLCAYQDRLVCLEDGLGWDDRNGFGNSPNSWIDVTDKYCLTEI